MHNLDLIPTLAGCLAAALVLGYLTQRVGLSPIVGYLLAGIAVGPYTPGFVADRELAEQLAEVGVILLMFGVGLHFHLEDLLAVRRVAVPGAVIQSLVATGLGAAVARAFGWDWSAGLVFGMALSVASTVVLTRVLSDNRDLHTPTGHIAVGWLVVEDLFTVVVLVLLPALAGGGAAGVTLALGLALLKIVALAVLTFLVGGRVIPWVLERVAATRSRELFTLAVLALALGIAAGSAKVFGVSMALGAFLAGMVVGRSEFSLRAASEALPMRDAFAVLFFVSVGMLLDPQRLWESPRLVAATLAVVLVGKPLAALALVLALRYPFKVALTVAVALAQIGEFSFILATLGQDLKLLTDDAMHALVAAAIISITLNPLLYRLVDSVEWSLRRPWLRRQLGVEPPTARPTPSRASPDHRAVVVGYGPVGRAVTRLLRENDVEPTVVELNLETVRQLQAEGVPAVYGDASHRETLEAADVARAGSLILSSAGMGHGEEVIRLARELNPDIHVLARAAFVGELGALRRAGAGVVVSGEGEVALALTEGILRELGATPEQIDRERERVRTDLLADGTPPPPGQAPSQPPSSG
jgi:monovalent cation:H+ antiporter-2, CPA2 family